MVRLVAVAALVLLPAVRPVSGQTPPSFASAVEVARAAVVTLRHPDAGDALERYGRVDDGLLQDAAGDEWGMGGVVSDLLAAERRRVSGAGIILDRAGFVLTSAHVASRASELEAVLPDGRVLGVARVGSDRRTDLAVVKLKGAGAPFPVLELADSDGVVVGDWVVAIGAPFGLETTVTAGIVSATRRGTSGSADGDLLQVDVALGPGNAGGAVVDTAGRLVAVTTAGGAASGLGFAVPAKTAATVFRTILEHGKVPRGWLGAFTQALTPALARALAVEETTGALIADVTRESPAAAAGLRSGDVVLAVDGAAVASPDDLDRLVAARAPLETVRVTRWRGGVRSTVRVVLGDEPDDPQRTSARAVAGLDLRQVAPGLGVVVTGVETDTGAARGGVREGDVIREIDGVAVREIADVERLLTRSPRRARLILVQRGQLPVYVTLTAPARSR